MTDQSLKQHKPLLLAALLFVAVAALYLPSRNYDYINVDDAEYVMENKVVKGGLTWSGVKTALTEPRNNFWMPMTWLSLMADTEFFGVNPGAYHRTNFILHALNALLLFSFLNLATGSPWKSFFAASLWALHPLRVESVAWVTERKDTLSGFFFLLCLLLYLLHRQKDRWTWYIASVAAMFAGLAAKPTVAVLSVILVITDFWPIRKYEGGFSRKNLLASLRGKIPFFVLSAVFSVTTMISQKVSLGDGDPPPWTDNLTDAITSNLYYVGKTVWPTRLFMLPRGDSFILTGLWVLLAALFLLAATYLIFRARRISYAIPAGWLWYLTALLPVSGILTLGLNTVADRFTYLPAMGLSFMAVWGIDGIIGERERLRRAATYVFVICLVALTARASFQLSLWKDSYTFFKYTYEETGSVFAERMLAGALTNSRNFEEAIRLYEDSIAKDPDDPEVYRDLGFLYSNMGNMKKSDAAFKKASELNGSDPSLIYEENARIYLEKRFYPNAEESALKALELTPTNQNAILYLGRAVSETGKFEVAEEPFKTLFEINPDSFKGRYEYGQMLAKKGDHAGALVQFREAARIEPNDPEAHIGAGLELARLKQLREAVGEFREAVRLDPAHLKGNFYLALAASQTGENNLAIDQYKKYLLLAPEDSVAHLNLGKVYAATGNRKEAAEHLEEALRLNPGDGETVEELRKIRQE
ncbi:tetratricopeptide repeat protein [bacterium]|nr:MAG: tetratricopeptide repeat protein [bacterium]